MRRAVVAALVGLAIASCGGQRGAADRAGTSMREAQVSIDSIPPLVPISAAGVTEAAAVPGARATLVNVWASWCGPCRAEFPDLMRFGQEYRDQGVRLVLVSVDFPEQENMARRFLAVHGAAFPSYIQEGDVMNFINTLNPEWSGAIPASFVYDSGGRLVAFHEGMASYQEFQQMVAPLLAAPRTQASGG